MVPLAQRGRRRHRSLAPALQRGPPAQQLAILDPGGVQAATPPRPATRHPLGITVSIKPSRSRSSGSRGCLIPSRWVALLAPNMQMDESGGIRVLLYLKVWLLAYKIIQRLEAVVTRIERRIVFAGEGSNSGQRRPTIVTRRLGNTAIATRPSVE